MIWITERDAERSTEGQRFTEEEWTSAETVEKEKWRDSCGSTEAEERLTAPHTDVRSSRYIVHV